MDQQYWYKGLGGPRREERAPQRLVARAPPPGELSVLREPEEPEGRVSSPVSATKVRWSFWGWKGRLKTIVKMKIWPRRRMSLDKPKSSVWCSLLFLGICSSTDLSSKAATWGRRTGHCPAATLGIIYTEPACVNLFAFLPPNFRMTSKGN